MPRTTQRTGCHRVGTLAGAIVAALACLALPLAAPAPAAAKGNKTRGLVVKQAHNPVLGALKRRLDRKLHIDHKPPLRRGKRRNHDLLVIDGDAFSAGRMARHKQLREFSNGGRWVLALDLGSKHHSRAIAKHTGFEALADGEHSSRAFLFRHAVVDGVPTELMLDSERLRPTGTKGSGKGKRRKSTRQQAKRVAGMVADRIRASDDELAQISGAAEAPADSDDIPPEALVVGWTYDVPGSVQPRAGHVSTGKNIPEPGRQVSEWTMRHAFKVYLDNSAIHPRGDFQIVTHDFSGSFNPASTGQFFQMFELERAWWTGLFGSTIAPADAATSSKLSYRKSEPPTENKATQVSSSESFDVGVAGSREGRAIDVSYSASHGREFSIADWSSINTSAADANRASWQFSSRQPCDPRPEASPPPEDNCFQLAGTFPNDPNLLSKGQITVDTSARWSTAKNGQPTLLTPSNGELSFAVDTPVTLIDLYCGDGVFSSCTTHHVDRQQVGPGPKTYTIDASDSLPVPIDSVDLKPTTANGKNNEVVEGTVKLQRKVPFDTTIVLYSTRENAFLEEPVSDQISKEEITIEKGDDTGTFEVQTNANNLKAGNEVVAYITAFYGGASEPAALTVQRPAS